MPFIVVKIFMAVKIHHDNQKGAVNPGKRENKPGLF
jgi:hypothetical protein